MLFSKQTYISRRNILRQRMESGLIVLLGNNECRRGEGDHLEELQPLGGNRG